MINISYKIIFDDEFATKDIPYEYDDTIYGDIIIKINNSTYYHEETVLDHWFNEFIQMIKEIKNNEIYSVKEIENWWDVLIFKKNKQKLFTSYVKDKKIIWQEEISFIDFKKEVVRVVNNFLLDLCEFNQEFKKSTVVSKMTSRIAAIEN